MYKDIKDIAKDVRKQLKKEFPDCKFSVTIDRFSMGESMRVSLMSAPFEAFADGRGYSQLNECQLRDDTDDYICNGAHLTQQAWEVMKRAEEIANKENWDNSDSSIDYFDVNYYLTLTIGKWDRPFQVSGAADQVESQDIITEEHATIQVGSQRLRFQSTGARGRTLIAHYADGVIDLGDMMDGVARGYFKLDVVDTAVPFSADTI